ncbi:hypothetical protein SIL08_05915 [Scandinavium sp. V105_16]|uniref:Uncharacterized protein n=1 Tax=Scandinavium lactucae TaxID=3095028 RepID=A0AAJ2S1N0_9ENTR|nr:MULTISPECIES: hypothetical protein [unclassified Scandinavium]MDX6019815.1 hypothetical protein [Scandinavium sp. V105_16]MDX6032791.1 hypothetical protein [Scandinavium sp. V105_12]MDX6039961.1 hypothetical protein [Scandinavium sp. V105_6]MDX6051851.1 hypothetical protein [Scandinavium sp. V105_1]
MKFWLSGVALLLASSGVWAENYRFVQSPSQKLDIWIDNIKSNSPQSWCAKELPLRIVANGDQNPSILNGFMPRLGTLLESQCSTLQRVHWRMEDPQGAMLAFGTADRDSDWDVNVTPIQESDAAAPTQSTEKSVPADRTPWQEFTLQDGCHLRTFWTARSGASALFIPDGLCEKGGWLSGRSEVVQSGSAGEKRLPMTFVHGFPVSGLRDGADANSLLITTLNNERMVVSNEQAPQSWMILPYKPELNAWVATGTIAVKVPREMAMDEASLQTQLNQVRKAWAGWLEPKSPMTLLLIDSLQTQLRDPAVGPWRTQN